MHLIGSVPVDDILVSSGFLTSPESSRIVENRERYLYDHHSQNEREEREGAGL
jgi:hypothetical protein